jgi:hypothetical protein
MRVLGMSVVPTFLETRQNKSRPTFSLASKKNPDCARFFVTKNGDMESELRQLPDWLHFGFIDVEAVERYKDN